MSIELGGHITLAGLEGRDFTELIVVKKMVGQYARKLSDLTGELDSLKVTCKEVHKSQVEIRSQAVIKGKKFSGSGEAHNLYVALDDSLKKVLTQVKKEHEKRK